MTTEYWWNNDVGKPKYSDKNPFSVTLFPTNSTG